MCGIAGLLPLSGSPLSAGDRLEAALQAMQASMAHRGPDGDGVWRAPDNRVGLAHRRLAIVDLSEAALQPMANESGTVVVTFNGEIYNHLELRRELVGAGYRFRTDHSDTEVLVHGYDEWGVDGLLERLDGMFAFGLWDAGEGRLILARDRIGIKPLYFCRIGGAFRFASEIKAILTDPDVPRDVEPAAVNHYLSFMVAPAPLTMFKGIYKLPAGFYMEVDAGGRMRARRYWDATPGRGIAEHDVAGLSDQARERFYTEGTLSRLESAIEKRMMSDVPFGVFLSGGIDSSANVALMSRLMDRPVETFTVGFKDHEHLNELKYATRVSREFKTNHHEVLIDERDMMGYLDSLVHHQDEPISDWVCVPLYFVSKLARDSGVPVVQVGEGSDEQFSGYNSYMLYQRLYRLFWRPYMGVVPAPLRKIIAAIVRTVATSGPKTMDRVADILLRAARNQDLFWGGSHAYWNVDKDRLVRPGSFANLGGHPDLEEAGLGGFGISSEDSAAVVGAFGDVMDRAHPDSDFLARMTYGEMKLRLPELLLMRVDKITMSTSVEGRVPFLDQRLVEFTMDIPMQWKVRNGEPKYILKKALAGVLPDDVLYRPKMGFGAPMADWLRGEFGRKAESDVLNSPFLERGYFNRDHIAKRFREHREGRRDNALHLWMLFNLTAWHDHWIGGA